MGLSSKAVSPLNICLKDRNEIVFNNTKTCSIFKSFFSNLAQNLVSKLLPSPNVFTKSKVASYSNSIRFLEVVKLQKSNHYSKKAPKLTLKTTAPFHCSPSNQKLLKGFFMNKYKNFWVKAKLSTDFNLVSKKTILETLVSDI